MLIEKCTCNFNMDEDTLLDSLYPINREKTVWNFCCQIHNYGCGRIVYGRSKEEVVERWNNKEEDSDYLYELSAIQIEKYLIEKERVTKNIKNF